MNDLQTVSEDLVNNLSLLSGNHKYKNGQFRFSNRLENMERTTII
jgi:hypothetical protein